MIILHKDGLFVYYLCYARLEPKKQPIPAKSDVNKVKLGELVALKPEQHPMEGQV